MVALVRMRIQLKAKIRHYQLSVGESDNMQQ